MPSRKGRFKHTTRRRDKTSDDRSHGSGTVKLPRPSFVNGGLLLPAQLLSGEVEASVSRQNQYNAENFEDEIIFQGRNSSAQVTAINHTGKGDLASQWPSTESLISTEVRGDSCDDIDGSATAQLSKNERVYRSSRGGFMSELDPTARRNKSFFDQAIQESSDSDSDNNSIVNDYLQNISHGLDYDDLNGLSSEFSSRLLMLGSRTEIPPQASSRKKQVPAEHRLHPETMKTEELAEHEVADKSSIQNAISSDDADDSIIYELSDRCIISTLVQTDKPQQNDGFIAIGSDSLSLQRVRRPRKKKKAAWNNPPQISDDELQLKFVTAWENDRLKKRVRKMEREELRARQLLNRQSPPAGEDSTSDVVLLRDKYQHGISITDFWTEFTDFCSSYRTELIFPPLDTGARKLIHTVVHQLGLKSRSHGKGSSRYLIVYKSSKSRGFDELVFKRLERSIKRPYFPRTDRLSSSSTAHSSRSVFSSGVASVKVRPGDRIGEHAPELGNTKTSSKAKAMMEKMGWAKGQALGSVDNKGILIPVEQVVWYSRAGLG